MTLFEFKHFSEVRGEGWDINTLKPPLSPREILLDFKIQWQLYSFHNLSFFKRLGFLLLRFFQRFAYNFGWIKLRFKMNKKACNGGESIA